MEVGKVTLRRVTEFSPDRVYRYTLWREWNEFDFECGAVKRKSEYLMIIGLNPSTADETKDDPTIRRCIGFAQRWGFGALCMCNLFAYRATKPRDMWAAPEPVGKENDRWLGRCAAGAGMVLAAWGSQPGKGLPMRAGIVAAGLPALYCLGVNKDGQPKHPLFVPGNTEPQEYFAP